MIYRALHISLTHFVADVESNDIFRNAHVKFIQLHFQLHVFYYTHSAYVVAIMTI